MLKTSKFMSRVSFQHPAELRYYHKKIAVIDKSHTIIYTQLQAYNKAKQRNIYNNKHTTIMTCNKT